MLSVFVKNKTDLENIPLDKDLYVVFNNLFNEDIILPPNVKKLKTGEKFNKELILSEGLTHLTLYRNLKNIKYPNSLKYLKIIYNIRNIELDKLPEGLTYLILPNYWSQSLDNLPSSLLYLEFGMDSTLNLDNLPIGLTVLKIGRNYSGNLDNLPITLKEIKFSGVLKLDKIPFGCKTTKLKI